MPFFSLKNAGNDSKVRRSMSMSARYRYLQRQIFGFPQVSHLNTHYLRHDQRQIQQDYRDEKRVQFRMQLNVYLGTVEHRSIFRLYYFINNILKARMWPKNSWLLNRSKLEQKDRKLNNF